MTRSLVIIGCGGFGREVFSIVQAMKAVGEDWQVAGFLDDDPSEHDSTLVRDLGSQILGPVGRLAEMGPVNAVIAIGATVTRSAICQRFSQLLAMWPVLVHPDSSIGANVKIDAGTIIAAGARLSTNINVGKHVHIDQNATVGHDVQLGNFVRLNPQACVSGSVTIGQCALIGANATVLQGLRVGADAVVGASACVVKDVAAATTVKGVPGQVTSSASDSASREDGGPFLEPSA